MKKQMMFRTVVDVPQMDFLVQPCEKILLVGSCFADHIGQCLRREAFPVTVNPYGVMYNPVSVRHTIEKTDFDGRIVFITLGTNHVYVLKETGEVVDNCQKRPQSLFRETALDVEECYASLAWTVKLLRERRPDVKVVVTVSPIRYAKYGYHGSALSKATLLLAAERLVRAFPQQVSYFPAYEIVNDELRDYRFYAPDMLHPSQQAVEYIWQRLVDCCFSEEARQYMDEWLPLREALGHRPFDAESEAYQSFRAATLEKVRMMQKKYPAMQIDFETKE